MRIPWSSLALVALPLGLCCIGQASATFELHGETSARERAPSRFRSEQLVKTPAR